jgi:hypothetical protein
MADVRGIVIYGLGGDDFIGVWNDPYNDVDLFTTDTLTEFGKLNIPVTMYCGDGDDELYSQSNADDLLVGGHGMDHAYVIDGHDRFAVESVENYRGCKWVTDPDTGLPHFILGGGFLWKGPEDEVYPDPYEVPTRNGTYGGGVNIPTFPEDDDDNGRPAPDGQSNTVVPAVPDMTTPASADTGASANTGTGESPAAPAATAVPPRPAASSSPFSVHPLSLSGDDHKPWDDVAGE